MKYIKSFLIVLSGFSVAVIIYLFINGYWSSFISSDVFWTIFMPMLIIGMILLRKKEDLKMGLFGKILLGVLAVFWIMAVLSLFSK
jgi:hypothetical protein